MSLWYAVIIVFILSEGPLWMSEENMRKNVPRNRKVVFGPSSFMSFKYVSTEKGKVVAEDSVD
jgi:hypothetical protein